MTIKLISQLSLLLSVFLIAVIAISATSDLPEDPDSARSLKGADDRARIEAAAEYLNAISSRAPHLRDQRARVSREARKLPEVPEGYSAVPPVKLSLNIKLRKGDIAKEMRRTFMRTSDRVYMNYENQGQEWLFEQNPVDKRRLSGLLVDHRKKHVLQYHHSELHNFGVVSSWNDVILLGVDTRHLDQLSSTGQIEPFAGIDFLHYVSESVGSALPSTEIWWSEAKALPLRVIHRKENEEWIQELKSIEWTLDDSLLVDPVKRFPEYPAMDYVDWQEEYHESSDGSESSGHGHQH